MGWQQEFRFLYQQAQRKRQGRKPSYRGKSWKYPQSAESRLMALYTRTIRQIVQAGTRTALNAVRRDTRADARLDAGELDLEAANRLMYAKQEELIGVLANPDQPGLAAAILGYGKDAAKFNGVQWGDVLKVAIGQAFTPEETWLQPSLRDWATTNFTLIKTLSQRSIDKVNTLARDAVQNGIHYSELKKQLDTLETRSSNHAKLIARDQIGKLNGALTKARMQDAGIEMYEWSTSADERVRGNPAGLYPTARPSHFVMDGKICRWDDPTVWSTDGGATWVSRDYNAVMDHPGNPIQCRCSALPYLGDYIETGAGLGPVPEPIPEMAAPDPVFVTEPDLLPPPVLNGLTAGTAAVKAEIERMAANAGSTLKLWKGEEGSLDRAIEVAVAMGIDPLKAVRAALPTVARRLDIPKPRLTLAALGSKDFKIWFSNHLDDMDPKALSVARTYRIPPITLTPGGGASRIVVDHDEMIIPKAIRDAQRGNGSVGKQLLRTQMAFYREVGIKDVKLIAGYEAGGYAWIRFGFLPTEASWAAIRDVMKREVAKFTGADQDAVIDLLNAVKDLNAAEGARTIAMSRFGKDLLAGKAWSGGFDLTDVESVRIFNEYTGSNLRPL